MSRKVLAGLGLLGVMVVAVFFRFYDIQNFPPGLFPDEAANGEDALLILEGDIRPFYARGNGREALFFYFQAASVFLFGVGVWQLHVVSALVGSLTVLATYFATRVWFGRLAGLLAALMLATSYWHVTLSRTGFRAILIPLFLALFTAWVGYVVVAVKQGRRGRSYGYAALTGLAFAGGFYTYIAYRVVVGVVGGVVLLLGLAALHPKIGWPHGRRYAGQIAVCIIAAGLALMPLVLYFVDQPEAFVGRAGQVSIFNKELQAEFGGGTLPGTALYALRATLLSFFAGEGDQNFRHSVAGFPLLNPLVGVLFLLGVAWSIRGTTWVFTKIVRGQEIHLGMIYPYLLLLLAGMLLPVVTTAEALPHGLRSIGLAFPIFLLAGVAGAVGIRYLKAKVATGTTALVGLGRGIAVGAAVLASLYDGALYFGVARNDAEAHYAYRGDLTVVAEYLRDHAASRPYLVLEGFSRQTTHFLLTVAAHDYEAHPDEDQHVYRAIGPGDAAGLTMAADELIVFTQSTMAEADQFAATHEAAQLVESRRNRFGQEIMRVYRGGGQGEVEGIQNEGIEVDSLDA